MNYLVKIMVDPDALIENHIINSIGLEEWNELTDQEQANLITQTTAENSIEGLIESEFGWLEASGVNLISLQQTKE